MLTPTYMLLVFVAALTVSRSLVAWLDLDFSLVARGFVFITLACWLVSSTRQSLQPQQAGAALSSSEQLRLKSLATRILLVTMLIYPALLNLLLSISEINIFVFDYLVALPAILLLVPRYVRFAETRMPQPDDAYVRLGEVLTGKRPWVLSEHRQFLLMWAVKIFFTPIMYSALILSAEQLLLSGWPVNPLAMIAWLFFFGLAFDLMIATGGYLFATRLLDNEVRSTDPTWLGWIACIICYPPFLTIFQSIRAQTDDILWHHWLSPDDLLYWIWAAIITLTWLLYWLSTVAFGLRFSNLSWRGLIDCGPYRYTKHPAYLAKNLYWWLHTVPLVGVADNDDLIRNLLGLGFVSLVYYLRAKTEERHLMAFPEYAEYATRIERDGLFARMGRWCRLKPA